MKNGIKNITLKKHAVRLDPVYRTIRLSKPIAEDSKTMLNEQIHAALLAITKGLVSLNTSMYWRVRLILCL